MRYMKAFGGLVMTLFLLIFAVAAVGAQQVYQVTVDTSPLNGQTGFVDLQFNPGGLDALAASVMINQVVTDGNLAAKATLSGGASGSLPGPPNPTIANSAGFNDLFQSITFGNRIRFDATFTGPALNPSAPLPSSGSTFALSLYDATGTTPELTTSADGSMLHLDVNPDGSMATTLFADSTGVFRAQAILLPASGVPESSSVLSLSMGLCMIGIALLIRRRDTLLTRKLCRRRNSTL